MAAYSFRKSSHTIEYQKMCDLLEFLAHPKKRILLIMGQDSKRIHSPALAPTHFFITGASWRMNDSWTQGLELMAQRLTVRASS